jgi:hypothetical protein
VPGARVQWRPSEEDFEVVGVGLLWFDDAGDLIGASQVVEQASITELRHALAKYREQEGVGDLRLRVFDAPEDVLAEDAESLPARPVELELAETGTFLVLVMALEPDVHFDRAELTAILSPQLERHRVRTVQYEEDPQPVANLAYLTLEFNTRGRTVNDALTIGDDLYELWSASVGGSLTPNTVADLLRARRPELLIGQPESVWFEAKGGEYSIKDELPAHELAKDVSALANRADGGILVLGLVTRKRGGVDTVAKVQSLPLTQLAPGRYRGLLDRLIFPPPEDLVIETVETEPGRGVMFILIPPQPEVLPPFLVTGAIKDGKLLGNHFSLVRRRDDETVATGSAVVHGWMVAGRAALAAQESKSIPPGSTESREP